MTEMEGGLMKLILFLNRSWIDENNWFKSMEDLPALPNIGISKAAQ